MPVMDCHKGQYDFTDDKMVGLHWHMFIPNDTTVIIPPDTIATDTSSIDTTTIDTTGIDTTPTDTSTIDTTTSDNGTLAIETVTVYPNPFDDVLIFNFFPANHDAATLDLYNDIGQPILRKDSIIAEKLIINSSSFASGIYFYRITSGENFMKRGKVILQR